GRREALNQEQKENLIALRYSGHSLRQLAKTFGISKTTAQRYVKLAETP
ncbi:MAG: helix-turn-helix domain-containing protein, partial [Gammaproteobacteria bacterium]|nr:helix-turn-helix domain-containing protein [Gammaproteobacteria bacterium]MYF38716.1 helix-turn-helix domain-containing protein [Gammaproteobacteria bacterium]